jgi:hypothetical protein
MAKVTPGSWTLTNMVSPSGEKQAPANSESHARLNVVSLAGTLNNCATR